MPSAVKRSACGPSTTRDLGLAVERRERARRAARRGRRHRRRAQRAARRRACERAALEAAQAAAQVGRARAERGRHVDARRRTRRSRARPARAAPISHARRPRAARASSSAGAARAVDGDRHVGAGDGDRRTARRRSKRGPMSVHSSPAAPSALPTSRLASTKARTVHRARGRDAVAQLAGAAEILHGRLRARARAMRDHAITGCVGAAPRRAAAMASYSARSIGAEAHAVARRAGAIGSARRRIVETHRRAAEHPEAARALHRVDAALGAADARRCPAASSCAASSRRGRRMRSGMPVMYGRPGVKPTK